MPLGGCRLVARAVATTAALLLLAALPWSVPGPAPEGALVLRMERSDYGIGDDVPFALHNGRAETLYLPCSEPWAVSRSIGAEWYRVENHPCVRTILALTPGGTHPGVWRSSTRSPGVTLASVEPGYYRIDAVAFRCPADFDHCYPIAVRAFFRMS